MMKKILRAIPVVLILAFCLSVTAMAYSGSTSVTLKTTQNEATWLLYTSLLSKLSLWSPPLPRCCPPAHPAAIKFRASEQALCPKC